MDCNNEHNHEETDIIYLTLEDGRELKCEVVTIFEISNKDYIVLLPEKEENVFLYRYEETEEGPELSIIESDSEYEKAAEVYNSMKNTEIEE